MGRCKYCGITLSGEADVCHACEWMCLGIREDIEKKAVTNATLILSIFQQNYIVKSLRDINQLAIDLMVGCEDDDVWECVGYLRKIQIRAWEEEMAARGYTPDGKEMIA